MRRTCENPSCAAQFQARLTAQVYCTRKCRDRVARAHRAASAARRCDRLDCHNIVLPWVATTRYCGKTCVVAAWKERHPDAVAVYREREANGHYAIDRDRLVETRNRRRRERYRSDETYRSTVLAAVKRSKPEYRRTEAGKTALQRQNRQRKAYRRQCVAFRVVERDERRLNTDPCLYCGSPSAGTWDHVLPLKAGGTHGVGNLVPACPSCNASKGAKLLAQWRYSPIGRRAIRLALAGPVAPLP